LPRGVIRWVECCGNTKRIEGSLGPGDASSAVCTMIDSSGAASYPGKLYFRDIVTRLMTEKQRVADLQAQLEAAISQLAQERAERVVEREAAEAKFAVECEAREAPKPSLRSSVRHAKRLKISCKRSHTMSSGTLYATECIGVRTHVLEKLIGVWSLGRVEHVPPAHAGITDAKRSETESVVTKK
jgi:predicted type IV restriction endonuclease